MSHRVPSVAALNTIDNSSNDRAPGPLVRNGGRAGRLVAVDVGAGLRRGRRRRGRALGRGRGRGRGRGGRRRRAARGARARAAAALRHCGRAERVTVQLVTLLW